MTIEEYIRLLKAEKITCVDVVKECISNIDKYDKGEFNINAVITRNDKTALKKAEQVDKKIKNNEPIGSFEGVPIAIKDVICTKDIRTTAASKILENYTPPYNATCVERLENEGAIIIAKVNCDEFAHGASGENSAYGATRNPFDTDRVAGGSSSGPAAIVAYGGALAAIGTDTGGSIRAPGSFCGLTGLKPTYGRASRYGLIAMSSSTDCVAPIAKTSADVALILSVISGKDAKDSNANSFEGKDFQRDFHDGLRGLRIGYIKESLTDGVNPKIKKLFNQSLKKMEAGGAHIDEVALPLFGEIAIAVYYIIIPSEISSNLAKFDGIKFGMQSEEAKNLKETYYKTRSNYLGDETKRRIMLGTYALSAGYYDEFYNKAQKVRALMKEQIKEVFKNFDILVTPTMAMPPFRIGEKEDPLALYLTDFNLSYASLTNISALTTNCGWIENDNKNAKSTHKEYEGKLPIGIQFMANWWDEETLLRASNAFEKIKE